MITIGVFEAKIKLSELCEQVSKRREPVLITRRGRPLVMIEPIARRSGKFPSIWDDRTAWEKKNGPMKTNLALPKRARQSWRNPIED